MTIWNCEWCGKAFELGPPSVDRYCSPKCYNESGAKAAALRRAGRIVEQRRAEEKREEERWNSLSKEEQEAELREQEEKKRKHEEFVKRLEGEKPYLWGVLALWGGMTLFFLLSAFSGKGNDFMFGMTVVSTLLVLPAILWLPGKLQDIIDPVDK